MFSAIIYDPGFFEVLLATTHDPDILEALSSTTRSTLLTHKKQSRNTSTHTKKRIRVIILIYTCDFGFLEALPAGISLILLLARDPGFLEAFSQARKEKRTRITILILTCDFAHDPESILFLLATPDFWRHSRPTSMHKKGLSFLFFFSLATPELSRRLWPTSTRKENGLES